MKQKTIWQISWILAIIVSSLFVFWNKIINLHSFVSIIYLLFVFIITTIIFLALFYVLLGGELKKVSKKELWKKSNKGIKIFIISSMIYLLSYCILFLFFRNKNTLLSLTIELLNLLAIGVMRLTLYILLIIYFIKTFIGIRKKGFKLLKGHFNILITYIGAYADIGVGVMGIIFFILFILFILFLFLGFFLFSIFGNSWGLVYFF